MQKAMQPKTLLQNRNSGQEVAKMQTNETHRKSFPKTHRNYWKSRLKRNCYTHQGKLIFVNEYSIRVQHLGKRKNFALGVNDAELAAEKAKSIYMMIVGKGWAAAEKEFNPEMEVRSDDPTLGTFLNEVQAKQI